MNVRQKIEIRGKGTSYSLIVDGRRLPRRLTSYDNAALAALRIEERHLREQVAIRPCICCLQPFRSSHRHHRTGPDCTHDLV